MLYAFFIDVKGQINITGLAFENSSVSWTEKTESKFEFSETLPEAHSGIKNSEFSVEDSIEESTRDVCLNNNISSKFFFSVILLVTI
jgi:hypothetical protein